MIEFGELKVGDRILDKRNNNRYGTVIEIEYNI